METVRINVSPNKNNNTISIPDRFWGKDVFVTITSFSTPRKPKKKVRVEDLIGVAKANGVSIDDVRYERLMAK